MCVPRSGSSKSTSTSSSVLGTKRVSSTGLPRLLSDIPMSPCARSSSQSKVEKLLRDVIKEYKAKSPAFRKQVHLIMRASYSHHYRRMVPELLEILDFRSNNELYRPVIRALQLVKDYVHSPRQYYPDHEIIPIKEVVAPKWREFVAEQDDDGTSRVNRLNYEVCTLQALREKVRVREIWIEGANRYRDPDDDLPTDFNQKRATYYEALRQPTEADVFIEKLKDDMRKALRSLDGAMLRIRDKVRLLPNRKKKPISITRLSPQPEPRNLLSLKAEDYRGLTPLFYGHVEPYGTLRLDMTQRLGLASAGPS